MSNSSTGNFCVCEDPHQFDVNCCSTVMPSDLNLWSCPSTLKPGTLNQRTPIRSRPKQTWEPCQVCGEQTYRLHWQCEIRPQLLLRAGNAGARRVKIGCPNFYEADIFFTPTLVSTSVPSDFTIWWGMCCCGRSSFSTVEKGETWCNHYFCI